VRIGVEIPVGRGRLAVGHHRDLGGGSVRGWSSALGVRRVPRGPVLSRGRASAGISWRGPAGSAVVHVGAGRHGSGGAVADGRLAWRGLEIFAAGTSPSPRWGVAGSGSWRRLPWRVEIERAGGGAQARVGIGGGTSPLGLTARLGRGGGTRRVAGGVRTVRGRWRGTRAEVAIGEALPETEASARVVARMGPWRLQSELRTPRRRWRAAAECRLPGARATVSFGGPRLAAAIRIDSGSPRSRTGFRVDLPPGRPRRVAAWVARETRFGRVRAEVRGNRDGPPAVDLEWGLGPGRSRVRARD
jgi:hypothetical protein